MNNSFRAGLVVGLLGMSAAITYARWRQRALAMHDHSRSAVEVNRWEGEGGNVPDVSVDEGHQASAGDRAAVLPEVQRTATNPDGTSSTEPWSFPQNDGLKVQ